MTLLHFDITDLVTLVLIVAIEVVGVTQFFKRRLKGKRLIVTFVTTAVCAFMNSMVVPDTVTVMFDLMFLGLAVATIAYQTIVDGIPSLVAGAFKKGVGNETSGG